MLCWTDPDCTGRLGLATTYTSTVNMCFKGHVRSRELHAHRHQPPPRHFQPLMCVSCAASFYFHSGYIIRCGVRTALSARHCFICLLGLLVSSPPRRRLTPPPLARAPTPAQSNFYWKVTAEGSGSDCELQRCRCFGTRRLDRRVRCVGVGDPCDGGHAALTC